MQKDFDLIEYAMVHNHECKHKDEEFVYRPVCRNGAAEIHKVVCIETGNELEIVLTRIV